MEFQIERGNLLNNMSVDLGNGVASQKGKGFKIKRRGKPALRNKSQREDTILSTKRMKQNSQSTSTNENRRTGNNLGKKTRTRMRKKNRKKKPTEMKTADIWQEVERILDSPRAKEGKTHISTMTEELVEILSDKREVLDQSCQTQNLMSRPMKRSFKRNGNGVDKYTQIEEGELLLIDFDAEVAPVVRVLVNRTLEQARMEVLEEEELFQTRHEARRRGQVKLALLNEIQRITIKEKRLQAERQRRVDQVQMVRDNRELEVQKLCCRQAAKLCVRKFVINSRNKLKSIGVFSQKRELALAKEFLPSLEERAEGKVFDQQDSRFLLSKLVVQSAHVLIGFHAESIQKKRAFMKKQKENRAIRGHTGGRYGGGNGSGKGPGRGQNTSKNRGNHGSDSGTPKGNKSLRNKSDSKNLGIGKGGTKDKGRKSKSRKNNQRQGKNGEKNKSFKKGSGTPNSNSKMARMGSQETEERKIQEKFLKIGKTNRPLILSDCLSVFLLHTRNFREKVTDKGKVVQNLRVKNRIKNAKKSEKAQDALKYGNKIYTI